MESNIEKYKADLARLTKRGRELHDRMQYECLPEEVLETRSGKEREKLKDYLESLPSFQDSYQTWYSESKALLRQLLPDRLDDFIRHYQKPKPRKSIDFENYRIEDFLQGLNVTRKNFYEEREVIVGPDAALPHFRQQQAILKSAEQRFESSLFDIKQLVQADVFDSELDASRELLKNGFIRAAGAIAGVLLEKHLGIVSRNHNIKLGRKKETIGNLNDALKENDVIKIPDWRFIQHLGDIRNLCDHDDEVDPTSEQVTDLIQGVDKVLKTLY